jgi:hypothetical protein
MKILVYATWKTGSAFFRPFYEKVCNLKKMKFSPLFKNTSPDKVEGCAVPFRSYPKYPADEHMHVVQLRDPRDMLVSLYYSMGYTHKYGSKHGFSKVREKLIDNFVLGKPKFLKRYETLLGWPTNRSNIIYLRYHNMVENFQYWLNRAVQPFSLTPSQEQLLFKKFKGQFKPVKENTVKQMKSGILKHKRKMTPGDYKEKLKKETIEKLNEKFKDIIQFINEVAPVVKT